MNAKEIFTTRRIVITGAMGSISIILGITHLGFIPWFAGAALTVMHVPVIIGAVLEGPIVGLIIGFIFGIFSLIQAAVAPTGPADVWFVNPLVSVFPRLLIGPGAWLVYNAVRRWNRYVAVAVAGIAGSLINTLLVLGMLGILGFLPWAVIGSIIVANGFAEAGAAAVLATAVVAAWLGIERKKRKIDFEEDAGTQDN